MTTFKLDLTNITSFVSQKELYDYQDAVNVIHKRIHSGQSLDEKSLGWLDYPFKEHQNLFASIGKLATEIKESSTVFIVIGVGGSYLGTRAVHDALKPYFDSDSIHPEVIYAGHNMSGTYLNQLLKYIKGKEVFVNVISKSGTTTEPGIAFRVLRSYMEARYGDAAKDRIVATTDFFGGALRKLVDDKGYRSFVIPDDIGGRFSVLTPVGLLPLAVAGWDIEALLTGAKQAAIDFKEERLESNAAYQYAVARQTLHTKGYAIEMLASFEPGLKNFHEWWKQLFAESEGKDGNGILPIAASFSTDLHAFGQYIQDGKRFLFETLLHFEDVGEDQVIPFDLDDEDGLNYLADKTLNEINALSKDGTALAHVEGGVPVIKIELAKLDEYHLGYLIYFFMKACMMSSYLAEVNPFDQPGVDAYKDKLFGLLGKSKVL